MKVIIVDDEQNAIDLLEWQLQTYYPQVTLVGKCKNAAESILAIGQYQPDLVMLDINMPNGDGFYLLEQLQPIDFAVVFTTAYSQYALKAFKYAALDYLLKPIDAAELGVAIKRCESGIQKKQLAGQIDLLLQQWRQPRELPDKVSFATQQAVHFILPSTIAYCESQSNYAILFFNNKQKLVVSKTLREVEELLEPYGFFRIHHSFLVNKQHIARFLKSDGGAIELTNGIQLPVSRQRKEEVMTLLTIK